MHLASEEQIIKTIHHHRFPAFINFLKVLLVGLPFYFVGWLVSTGLSSFQSLLVYAGITVVFLLIASYGFVLDHLDRLVITNCRIVHIDWRSFSIRKEHEAQISDIQTINTTEHGFLSRFRIFDYGTFELETSSTGMVINFENAPDPEGIKHFLYHMERKPSKITPHDKTTKPNTADIEQSTTIS